VSRSFERTLASIRPADPAAANEAGRILDAKTKPPGSLGRLEDLARRLSAIRGAVPAAPLRPAVVVAAADHGVWIEGVSPYPQAVTSQMLTNFVTGGAAVAVLARQAGARLIVVDAGVRSGPSAADGIRSEVVDGVRGTGNIVAGSAMPRDVAVRLIERGTALVHELADDGVDVVAIGDMGIANTTAASACCAALLPAPVDSVCGPGTGLDDAGVARKACVVRAALAVNGLAGSDVVDPLRVLAAVGGLEIALLVGVILGAAARRMPVVLDGFVTGAAALVAARLAPSAVDAMIAATRSPEPGHALVLERLGLQPLLDLGLRLGEGSAAALALPIVRASVALLLEMATFDHAEVSRA